jgi:predicted tellurium resistance membrane protein TerC
VTSLLDPSVWGALLTLTALEIVLGIDNIVFISILVSRIPAERREGVRRLGLGLALGLRLALLSVLRVIMQLKEPLFTIPVWNNAISGRDLILIGGGLFLLAKSSQEIYKKLEGPLDEEDATESQRGRATLSVLAQIALVDVVFSLDSVITAVGMVDKLWIMVVAMIASVGFMLAFARSVGDFVERHPSVKLLALSFLLLIGFVLVAEGLEQHVSKGLIYFSMAFALGVELLNMRFRKRRAAAPVSLHGRLQPPPPADR